MSTDPTADVALTEFIDPKQVKEDMDIDLADLSSAMQRHSSMYVYYAGIAVRARAQSDRWKSAFEILESQLDSQHRATLKEENAKTTEAQIRAAVVNDPKWRAAQTRLLAAQTQWRLAETVERGFEHRKDMLLQIARGQLREADGPLRVIQNAAAAEGKDRFLAAASARASSSAEAA